MKGQFFVLFFFPGKIRKKIKFLSSMLRVKEHASVLVSGWVFTMHFFQKIGSDISSGDNLNLCEMLELIFWAKKLIMNFSAAELPRAC